MAVRLALRVQPPAPLTYLSSPSVSGHSGSGACASLVTPSSTGDGRVKTSQ
jgi:hypothetical protein